MKFSTNKLVLAGFVGALSVFFCTSSMANTFFTRHHTQPQPITQVNSTTQSGATNLIFTPGKSNHSSVSNSKNSTVELHAIGSVVSDEHGTVYAAIKNSSGTINLHKIGTLHVHSK